MKFAESVIPRQYTSPEQVRKIVQNVNYELDLNVLNKGLSEPLWDFLDRGGKRWRPILTLMTADCFGGNPKDVIPLAVSCELLHNGSLICDDIEDNSQYRRGAPSTFVKYGLDTALNAGCTLYMTAYKPIIDMDIEDSLKVKLINEVVTETCAIHFGQCTDIMWNKSDFMPSEAQYLQMVSLKTSVLARLAIKLAAIYCGVEDNVIAKLAQFAENIGIAFQIQDDIINLTSAEYAKGRSYVGEDITEGKKSLLVIKAAQQLPEKSERLFEILKQRTDDQSLVQEAIDIILESKAIEIAKQQANDLLSSGWNGIEPFVPESEAKGHLKSLSDFLINRDI